MYIRTSAQTWTATTTARAPADQEHVFPQIVTRARRSTCANKTTEAAVTLAHPPMDRSTFFQLVLVVFLHMKEPLRRPHVSDQVYCSCPTGEQLGDDWKTCRAPPQCPEVHTEIVFPDLLHFFIIPGRLFEGRGVCAKMWGGGPMGGRHLCPRPGSKGRIRVSA